MADSEKNEAQTPPAEVPSGDYGSYGNYGGYAGYGYGYGQRHYGGYAGYGAKGYPGYGYAGKGSYHGYHGYHGESEGEGGAPVRTLRDYLLTIYERKWLLIFSVFVFVACGIIFVYNRAPEYQAAAKLRVYRDTYKAPTSSSYNPNPSPDRIQNTEDFNTLIDTLKTTTISDMVYQDMDQSLRAAVLEPYQKGNIFTGPLTSTEVLAHCRDISPGRGSLTLNVTYFHTDQVVAVKMAQLFTDKMVAFVGDKRERAMRVVEPTQTRIAKLNEEIKQLNDKRQAMLSGNVRLLSLDSEMGTLRTQIHQAESELRAESSQLTTKRLFKEQLEELKKKNASLTDVSLIALDQDVRVWQGKVKEKRIELEALGVRFMDRHPTVEAAKKVLAGFEISLDDAVKAAEHKFYIDLALQESKVKEAEKRVEEYRRESIALSKEKTVLDDLNAQIASKTKQRGEVAVASEMEIIKAEGGELPSIEPIEKSSLVSMRAINKDYLRWALFGAGAGFAFGLAIIFGLAAFDDRVKSVVDIEGFLGLPLIGILPTVTGHDSFAKARLVGSGKEPTITEAFRAVYSALKIKESSQKAKVILVTSTSPSEGKSFASTNLAMTFALQGEKVLLIDADLRMPVIAKTLKIESRNGIKNHLQGKIRLEDAIQYGYIENLDVLPSGGVCKNPTKVINSNEFAKMIQTLRTCYDRILIDSPPIGAVSDVLNLLPMVDGVLYVVRFNGVRKRFIGANIQRLRETNKPILGAMLNQISVKSIFYYTNSDHRSYNHYYTRGSGGKAGSGTSSRQNTSSSENGRSEKSKKSAKTDERSRAKTKAGAKHSG